MTVAAQPTRGLDVGAIEFVHRRLLEQRDAGRGVLLVSLELEEIRSLADRVLVIYEGRIVAELAPDASDEELGVAMLRREGRGRVTRPRARRRRGPRPVTVASRLAGYLRGGGVLVPVVTALLAFLVGGLVVLATGANPIEHLQGDLRGLRPQLAVPVGHGRRPHARRAEPAADAAPDHAADPHRPGRRVRLPRRPVQHRRPGPVPRRHVSPRSASARRSTARRRSCTCCSRSLAGLRRPAPSGRASPGLLKATTGANEVISTIMLNWIAVYVGMLPVRPRRAAAERRPAAAVDPGLQRRARRARGCRCSGATRSCRACTSASSSRSSWRCSSGCCSTAR